MNLYFDSINWTVAGRKIEIIKEDDQFNPQVGLQKAKKLVESDKVDLVVGHPGEQRRARGAQLHEAAEGVLCRLRRRHRRHHLGPLSLSVPHLDLGVTSSARRWRTTSTTTSARRSSPPRPTMPAAAMSWRSSRALPRQGRQGAEGNLAAARHHGFQPLSDRHQVDQSAGDLRFHAGRRRRPLHPAIFRVRPEGENAADRLHHHRLADGERARQGRDRRHLGADLYRHRRQSRRARNSPRTTRPNTRSSPDLFADYGYVARQGARRGAEDDRRRRVQQGQARRGDDQGQIQCAARPVPHGPGDAQSDPGYLHLSGHRQRQRDYDQNLSTAKDVQDPGKKLY